MSDSIPALRPFSRPRDAFVSRRTAARPTPREWVRHAVFLFLTALTTTFAGIMLAIPETLEPAIGEPSTWFDYLIYVPVYYLLAAASIISHAVAHPALIVQGLLFSGALLSILLAHEAGHYVACRRYGVTATLPFFIPAPPLFLAGTFGAFIKIKSPIPSRRALFDIGLAGPLAGFAVILPVTVLAMLTAQPAPPLAPSPDGMLIVFNSPLLLELLAKSFGIATLDNIAPNPFYFAAWIGLLVTSLNLLPVGQLDGGHATFSIFGARAHRLVGRAAFAVMVVLAPLGWFWHGTLSGFVYGLLLFVMLRVAHPQAGDETDRLGRSRILVALLTLAVFALSFTPFPITIR